ncbi:MAG: phage holin [Candidatus Pelethousia sp.]|nr:phage holin [Candidatus Pelethousia sp.]
MQINWKVRFKNKVWLMAFLTFGVSTVYQLLGLFDIVPALTQDAVMQAVAAILQLLSLLGVVVDPTTKGLGDSERALTYTEPN